MPRRCRWVGSSRLEALLLTRPPALPAIVGWIASLVLELNLLESLRTRLVMTGKEPADGLDPLSSSLQGPGPACVAIGQRDGVTALEEGLLPGASAASAWATGRSAEARDRELESTTRSLGWAPLRW